MKFQEVLRKLGLGFGFFKMMHDIVKDVQKQVESFLVLFLWDPLDISVDTHTVLEEDLHESWIRVERLLEDCNRSWVAKLEKDAFNITFGNSDWLGTEDLLSRREYIVEGLLILFPCQTLYKESDLKSGLESGSILYELEDLFE